MDMKLFYSKVSKLELTGYAETNYLSDPRNGRPHILFLLMVRKVENAFDWDP